MFVDYVKITVKAGNGGNGAVTFHREKYVDNGGPDGGDGGSGGSIYFIADKNMNTLLNFRYTKKVEAENGSGGQKKNMTGRSADDIYVPVPVGTVVKDISKNRVIADLKEDKEVALIAKGGNGGKGNEHFANSTRQAPRFAEIGEQGEEKQLELELKLIADVGLIGFPNVGKSTIISMVSEARPKIANYHFTTLEPSLGVVKAKNGNTFVMADIPGIIEGASSGVGLGLKFLKHVERTRLLLHVIDISGSEDRDPVEDYMVINEELKKFSENLSKKKQIVVANKVDIMQDENNLKRLQQVCDKEGVGIITISAATKTNMDKLVDMVGEELEKLPKEEIVVNDDYEEITLEDEKKDYTIENINNEYFVKGRRIENLMRRVNFNDLESRQYMQRILKTMGVIVKLKEMGIKEGDSVDILGFKFDWEE